MLNATQLTGCYPAIITPMKEVDGDVKIDYDHFFRIIERILEAGCTGIVIAGTTGQSSTLSHGEHIELVVRGSAHARRHAKRLGRAVQVIGSAGSNSTAEALYMSERVIEEAELDALLHVTGYYNNPPQEGLLKHFRKVADFCAERDMGIVMYNVPSRTKSNLEAATCIELAKHPAIIGVKEASGDLKQVGEILAKTDRESFTVVSGEDDQVAAIMRMGGRGVISASANRWPREFQVLTELANAGNHAAAAELQEALLPCVRAVFSAKNPIPLHHMFNTAIRLPLVTVSELSPATQEKVLAIIGEAEAIAEFPHVAGVAVR